MIQPIKYPNHFDVIREQSHEYQLLSSYDKTRIFIELIQTGLDLLEISPNKEQVKQLSEDRERQWQLAHSKLFERFMKEHAPDCHQT